MPWKLVGDYGSYITGWLVGYSGLLGPVAGTMIADYFIVRRRSLQLQDLCIARRARTSTATESTCAPS